MGENAEAARARQAAAEAVSWLCRLQQADGSFLYGWNPGFDRALEGDNALRQAGTAAALAHAASLLEKPQATPAAQAARRSLRHLLDTTTKLEIGTGRRLPTLPPDEANPVGLAALLLWAISELPETAPPAGNAMDTSLTVAGEQLAAFLCSRQRADGSFDIRPTLNGQANEEADDPDDPGLAYYPGEALYALCRSHAIAPAAWKQKAVSRGLPYYIAWWRAQPNAAAVAWLTLAAGAMYHQTGELAWARCVFVLNDWLVELQYSANDPVPAAWHGGFARQEGSVRLRALPGIDTASQLESLAEACRTTAAVLQTAPPAEEEADLRQRLERYTRAGAAAAAFVGRHQFTEANTAHLQPASRARIRGAFFAHTADSCCRIDFAQHALHGLLMYAPVAAPPASLPPTREEESRCPVSPAPAPELRKAMP